MRSETIIFRRRVEPGRWASRSAEEYTKPIVMEQLMICRVPQVLHSSSSNLHDSMYLSFGQGIGLELPGMACVMWPLDMAEPPFDLRTRNRNISMESVLHFVYTGPRWACEGTLQAVVRCSRCVLLVSRIPCLGNWVLVDLMQ